MKYSRTVLIFLLVSSTVSAFYYALDRTNGNVGQSIMFTMYFLAIKIGSIGPTVVRTFDPPQQNEQLVAKARVLPVFHPYISASNDSFDRPSRLYMGETKMGTHYSRSASPIAELRAGSRAEDIKQTAYLLVSIWYALKLQQSYGFQPLPNQVQMPHLEAVNNFLFGKPKTDKYSSYNKVPTELNMGRSRMRRSVRQIDMKEEYQKFLLIKHPNTNCSAERFTSLCTDPQRSIITDSSIKEAIIILECEGRGIVQQAERPNLDNGEPNLDFRINGPGGYEYADVKEPRNYGRGNSDLDKAAQNMGKKIHKQKNQSEHGVSRQKILHIVNFELLNASERVSYETNLFSPHGSDAIIIVDITKRN